TFPDIINLPPEKLQKKLSKNKSNKFTAELVTKKNEKIPVEIKFRNVHREYSDAILTICRDITERKEYEEQLLNQKEELEASNQQLTAFSEEIVAMNKELNHSFKQIENLNKRFNKMIEVITELSSIFHQGEEYFLSELLDSAIEIVYEADYGKICIFKDDQCKFIAAVGHDIDQIKNLEVSQDLVFDSVEEKVRQKRGYALDFNKLPEKKKKVYKNSLQPIKESLQANIMFNSRVSGKIILDIAQGSQDKFCENAEEIMKSFSNIASVFLSFQRYYKLQGEFNRELVTAITSILEIYDEYTSNHSKNVAEMSSEIAKKMELSDSEVKAAYWAGMVHDIGKLIIPLEVINKTESLSDKEYRLIEKHPVWTYEALKKSERLNTIARYALYHHERWDGEGYPQGLKGDEIPVISQIISLADAWDAMRSQRAYRPPLTKEEALQEVKENNGTQFAPRIVEVFLEIIHNN
ncbi:MAG: HD domain-containing phosphohydrolase, partial [Halanaerobiaceae bacterium]